MAACPEVFDQSSAEVFQASLCVCSAVFVTCSRRMPRDLAHRELVGARRTARWRAFT